MFCQCVEECVCRSTVTPVRMKPHTLIDCAEVTHCSSRWKSSAGVWLAISGGLTDCGQGLYCPSPVGRVCIVPALWAGLYCPSPVGRVCIVPALWAGSVLSQPCGQGLYCPSPVGRVCIVPALWAGSVLSQPCGQGLYCPSLVGHLGH